MRRHGLAGIPGRTGRSDTRCWRDDICSLAVSRIASSHPGMARDLGQELVDLAQVMLAPRYPSWSIFQEICPFLKGSSDLYQEVAEQQLIITEKGVQEVKKEGIVRLRKKRGKKVLKEGKAFSQVKKKKIAFLQDHLVLEKKKFKKEVRHLARQEGKTAEEERKLSKPEKKLTWEKEKLIKDKNLTHQQEKIAWEEKTLASSQKKLTRGEQELVLREKKWTGRDRKVLGERKGVIWKEGKAIPGRRKWDLEETWLAQKEGISAQEEGLPIWEEMKLSQEEEKADEREEETGEGGEDLVWDEEEPILDVEKQVEEKKKKPYKEKKHIPEGKWAFKKGSLAEQEIKLTPEKKKWSVKEKKEVHKKKQIQEKKEQVEKQEKEGQKERQAKKDEKEAKDKQLAWKRKKLGLETEKFGEMKVLSQEDKQTEKKVKEAWEKERRAQKEEKATKKQRQQVWGRNKVDLREEGQGDEMEKWSQKDKKQAWGKRMQDQKEERLAGKVEKEEDKKQAWGERTRDQKEEGLAGKVEKEEDKKRAWGERITRDQKEERLAGKVEKEEDKKRAWGERTRDQKEERLAGKVEKKEDKKWAWGERMQDQKEKRLAGKVEKEEDKKRAWGERMRGQKEERLKEERLAGKVEKEEDKKRAWGERTRDQKEERLAGKVEKKEDKKRAWGERTRDQKEERLAGKVEKEEDKKRAWGERTRDQKEERLAGKVEKEEDKKRAWGERTRDQKEERLAGKVEKEEDKKRAWGERTRDQKEERLATEKMKLVPEVEEKRKEIGKVSPKGEQQLMKKEKEAKKGEKLFGRDKKVTEENKQRTYEKGQLALQGETRAQEERMWHQKKAKDSEHKEHWAWGKEKLFLDEEQAGEMEEKSQEKAIMKKEGKLSQEERQLAYDRTKETDVANGKKKRTQQERIQAMGKLVMKRRVSSEEKEALSLNSYLRMREHQLRRILAKTVREIIRVPLEEIKIPEEERSSIIGRSEIDGKRWEILKEQEKITKEKEVDQKESKVEGDRLATEERTLTDDEGFEEDQWLLEKVQETILLDQIQVESVLNEIQEQNLLGGEQLKELQKRIENKSEKIQVKWLLENIRDILFEGLSESLTEQETEEGPTKEGKEEESLSKEERTEKIEREEERQEEEAALTKEKEEVSILKGAVLSEEERVLKTELSKEGVSSRLVKEGKILAEEREGTARREAPFKKERFLDGKRHPTFMDKLIWPTVPKSPFKIPLPVALEKKEGMPLKILGDRLDLEGRESQLGRASPRGRKEDRLLEKARGIFLQETGLETQIPRGLHRPGPCLPGSIIKPQKPEHRLKGGRWKWFVKYRDSSAGKSEGQAPAPAPVPAPSLTSLPAKTETSFSDEDWVNNALIRLKAGEQLSRDSFHRLNQLLRDFTSKGYLKWMHLYNLKTIAKHLRPNLEASHTDIPQPYKDVLSPLHLKVIPPIRRIEKESWREPLPSPEPVLPSATRTQTPQAVNWHLLAESYRKKQAQQLSTAVKEIKHICPTRKDEKPLALIFQKDFQALRGRGESPKFHKAKRKPLPIPAPVLPSTTKEIQVPMAINWHHLGEPYRSARVQQLISALREMEMRHFYPAQRDIFQGARASVEKQTLALMFQKDLRAFKGKGKLPKLPQLEKVKTNSKRQEDVPLWETFVALYHVLRMLQERYAEDGATWMEQFYQVMDLYQLKSPGIQRLLLELLQRRELQPQETIYKKALKTKEPVLGERLFCGLFCGRSHTPAGPLKFQDVIPLPGQNRVHTLQNVGIARYGFLELAWKSLPQVNPSLIERLPNIPTPTL
ncbi:PREDICTED: WD repeat-containing protein 87-like [Miniopterus natalensis]|uniref:WD repeat-containing protein 87-like n=1 Tax=Miniopterus natalensis TaxID=291302 RepID=UPI0007A71BDC|nr:PREDICTED: WD repeat-containing protein 87-like [Miniopterus natalensis]